MELVPGGACSYIARLDLNTVIEFRPFENSKTFAQSKSIDSVKYGLAPYRITKVSLKGKAGVDLRHNSGLTYHAEWTPYWETVGAKPY